MPTRDHTLKVRLSSEELAALDRLCATTGLRRAEQVRFATLGQSADDALAHGAELAALKAELGKIGSNLNQIAHVANGTGHVGQLGELYELRRLVARVHRAIRR